MIGSIRWRSLIGVGLGTLGLISAHQMVRRQAPEPPDHPAIIRDGLRVGVVMPMSGSYAVTGQPLAQVFPLLMRRVNACGGVNAAPVVFVMENDRSDPAVASRAMFRLALTHEVQVFVGGVTSEISSEMVENIERLEVPVVSPASTSIDLPSKAQAEKLSGLYWARTVPSDAEEAQALANLAIARSLQSVAVVAVDNSFGTTFAKTFTTAFQEQGGTVVTADTPIQIDERSPESVDLAIVEQLEAAQAVLVIAYPEPGSQWLQSALEQDILGDRQVLLTSSVYTPRFLESLGAGEENKSQIQGALGLIPGTSSSSYLPLKKLWEEQEGYAPPTFVAHTWDAGALVLLAAEAAGRNDSQGIANELQRVANPPGLTVSDICRGLELLRRGEDIDYQGASGPVDIDTAGNVTGQYNVWTVNDQGRFDVLYPLK